MLKFLKVQNYILIDYLNLVFEDDLTCITGESGSGKSIILEILQVIKNPKKQNIAKDKQKDVFISAMFEKDKEEFFLEKVFKKNKTKAYLNKKPISLSDMSQLCDLLFDFVNQFDNINYLATKNHINILESFIGENKSLKEYQRLFESYKAQKNELKLLVFKKNEYSNNLNLFSFYLKELEDAKLEEDEDVVLNQKLKEIQDSKNILDVLQDINLNFNGENKLKDLFLKVNQDYQKLKKYNLFLDLQDTFSDIYYNLEDISLKFQTYHENYSFDFLSKEQILLRIDFIESLKIKFKKNSIFELLNYKDELNYYINNSKEINLKIEDIQNQVQDKKNNLLNICQKLTENRIKKGTELCLLINDFLSVMGMPNLHVMASVLTKAKFDYYGKDDVKINLSSDKKNYQPISSVASGGELSRLLLIIKTLIHKNSNIVIIMDEIESGVSGELILSLGKHIKEHAKNKQIICITHSPSIAVFAKNHIKISKDTNNNVYAVSLSKENIVEELARMIGNSKDVHAINYVQELVKKYNN